RPRAALGGRQQHPAMFADGLGGCCEEGWTGESARWSGRAPRWGRMAVVHADRTEDVQATFCATLVDEWALGGVRFAVLAPGSRSTPLALALAAHGRIELHVHHDERSAGFMALGMARATGSPAVVLTTSGTAAAELHPAVVEADLDLVPMIVC